ncbi:hypothetical protein EV653_5643 [Kribbella pratensis]|uniref:PIN like domain-containing protein n=2 Tax=Kribbella pratensis TaxID=2512112 RepID=A0A4R8BV31_9ACTN|nr:hypothetical protein EV653_5643 [Kribbella pratensis]
MGGFEQYHPPSDSQWAEAYRTGLIALDTNALLDLYKFSPTAREQYLDVLTQVKDQLFVPHQVALEFHRNRIGTVKKHLAELDKNHEEVRRLAKQLEDSINRIGKRNLQTDQLRAAQSSIQSIESLSKSVIDSYAPIPRDMGHGIDEVLARLIELLDGHVGNQPTPETLAADQEEGRRRFAEKIAPGFADTDKDHGINGDYLLWAEIKRACAANPRPVLLVTNDVTKGDWIFESGGIAVGAHVNLI